MFRSRKYTHKSLNSKWKAMLVVAVAAVMMLVPSLAFGQAQILDVHNALPDLDARTGKVAPTSQQLSMVSSLGARASWNEFGTPQSLIKYSGYLATGLTGDAVTAARNWIRTKKALFRLSDQGVDNLELLNDSKMSGYDGHAVIFRQLFGDLPATHDGMITVGITGGKIVYVSSSIAGDQALLGKAVLTAPAAWVVAAISVGFHSTPGDITNVSQDNSWTLLSVTGFSHAQRARLVAFPTYTQGVLPAYETIVLDVQGGSSKAYKIFVHAQTGEILFRQNAVQQFATSSASAALALAPETSVFTGTYQDAPAPQACGPFHPFTVPAGTFSIDVVASEAVVGNDIVLKLFYGVTEVASADTATSPEVIHYEPTPGIPIPPGVYNVQVCPFNAPTVPPQEPYNYAGTFTTNDVAGVVLPDTFQPPRWKVFPANPKLDLSTDDLRRKVWCWLNPILGALDPACDNVHPEKKELYNLAARFPWDYNTRTNTPTFTTIGNAAISAEAWGSPLTPAEPYRPVAANREYIFPWTNQWQVKKCDETMTFLTPERNDIDAATANLFGMHNRLHDWSYFLGFTERNFNAQDNNFGNTAPGPYPSGREFDAEIGNSQAGAVSGGPPTYLGRDNANQISLNDGVPPITNMYLWQPIAGAFYAPCVDGDYDMAVIGHEYTHLISNRMVGGPDSNLTGAQAGAMGESWSDLDAVEYLNEYKFVPTNGENPFSVGAYATGNLEKGIRNYNMSRNIVTMGSGGPPNGTPSAGLSTANPLNYSNIGYDLTGPQVHADGEIWSATNYDIRQALITKYNASFPASNAVMQRECADGIRPPYLCPGNRRWIQIVYDAWLLMPPGVSMLDARDAYLAADVMRAAGTTGPPGWSSNQKELWKVFALRGMGFNAMSAGSDDGDPTPNFESAPTPVDLESEKTVTFRVFAADESNTLITTAKIFVGHYEARSTPIADTNPGTTTPTDTAKFVTGTYDFLVQAPGYGHLRFPRFFTAGGTLTLDIYMSTNRASTTKGAVASGTGSGLINLIDDTEGTNWTGIAPVNLQQVTVDLQGGVQNVKRVNVSAMGGPAPQTGGRFTALRQFEIWTCNTTNPLTPLCLAIDFTKIFTSPADAFPGVVPRPAAPDMIIRSFDVPDTNATHVRLQVVTNQCTAMGTGFRGEQDLSVLNVTDCVDGSTSDDSVRATELQVFASTPALPPRDPAVVFTMTAPATVAPGSNLDYNLSYTNLGPFESSNARITVVLPAELDFVSAMNGGIYNAATRTVTWNLGTINVNFTGTIRLTARVKQTVTAGTVITNQAEYTADMTVATPAATLTAVVP